MIGPGTWENGSMAYKPFVAVVKGSNPERFLLGTINLQISAGNFMNTSDSLLECDFREMLATRNVPPDAIEAIVQEARQNPM
jgi:hypothetical protein